MPFLNIPIKSISLEVISVVPTETMSWVFPSVPPANPPVTFQKAFRWSVQMRLPLPLQTPQTQSSAYTRNPGQYNCMDINVGMWIADINTGSSWQIIEVTAKTTTEITIVVQDIYRYNTFKDRTGQGNGGPPTGNYIAFELGPNGLPAIDTADPLSSAFTQNISGRFDYINLQYDYPLYQVGNSFGMNDVIAVDQETNTFVLATPTHKLAVGRVTSISDTISGWFTINPVQKVVDNLDYLPGNVGDIIYSSNTDPSGVTTVPGGAPIYIKLRNNTQTTSISTDTGPTTPGNQFELNEIIITVDGSGTTSDLLTAVNAQSANTGVSASSIAAPTIATTNIDNTKYGQVALFIDPASYATSTINGTLVTFNIASTLDPTLAFVPEMVTSINNANVANIVASSASSDTLLVLTNTAGGSIDIVNLTADIDGMFFAGPASGSGLPLSTSASNTSYIQFTAVDARPIDFLDVTGLPVEDFGLISTENGIKAAGLYIEGGLRQVSTTVVADLAALNALSPIIGDQAYVIDSDDGLGNNVGQWSMWLYDGADWVQTQTQAASESPGKTILSLFSNMNVADTQVVGTIQTFTRITTITVYVSEAFDGPATLDIGYDIGGVSPQTSVDGLMPNSQIDLNVVGTYTTTSNIVFGNMTTTGDVDVIATFDPAGSTTGLVRVTVSYV